MFSKRFGTKDVLVGSNEFQVGDNIFDHFFQQLGPNVSKKNPQILFKGVNRLGFFYENERLHDMSQKVATAQPHGAR